MESWLAGLQLGNELGNLAKNHLTIRKMANTHTRKGEKKRRSANSERRHGRQKMHDYKTHSFITE
jgi:hypothetical protein